MNIPPDNQPNDLNRGPATDPSSNAIASTICSFVNQVYVANREWTDVKDFAFRLAVPLFSMVATALYKQYLDKKEAQLDGEASSLRREKDKLLQERKLFEEERGAASELPLAKVADELMSKANRKSYQALQEIDALQPVIKEILKVRCSPTTKKEERAPLEKEMRTRILRQPSPFDSYSTLKNTILEDTFEIIKKDVAHCDYPWPIGCHDNGELYKVYRENWKLRVELEKYKHVLEQLKYPSFKSQDR